MCVPILGYCLWSLSKSSYTVLWWLGRDTANHIFPSPAGSPLGSANRGARQRREAASSLHPITVSAHQLLMVFLSAPYSVSITPVTNTSFSRSSRTLTMAACAFHLRLSNTCRISLIRHTDSRQRHQPRHALLQLLEFQLSSKLQKLYKPNSLPFHLQF